MMSDAEEMLLATVNRHRDTSDQAKAGPENPADAGMSTSKAEKGMAVCNTEPVTERSSTPAAPTSQALRPIHEGAHVRNARLSTSDARKADHELSSTIVALSSGTVFNEKHASSHLGIPLGALVAPALAHNRPEQAQHEPVCCSSCDAYLNMYSEVDQQGGHWTCQFCSHSNSNAGSLPVLDSQVCPELTHESVEYVESSASDVEEPLCMVLAIDIQTSQQHIGSLKQALLEVVSAADDRTLFGLLTLDAAIAVFDLSQHQAVSALALPGDRPLSPPLLSILEQGMHSHVMPLAQCRAQAQAAITSLRSSDRAHERHHGSAAVALSLALHMARSAVAGRAASPSQDCSAPGIPEMTQSRGRTSPIHILLLSADGTPQTHPVSGQQQRKTGKSYPQIQIHHPEDLEMLSRIGDSAVQLGAIVDVIAVGDTPVHARQLLQLTQRTGGTILHSGVEGLQRGALARFMDRHVSRQQGTLEVYLSHGLAVTSVLGPVARAATASPRLTAQAAKHEQHDRYKSGFKRAALQLLGVDTYSCVALHMDVIRPLQGTAAYMQVVLSWRAGGRIHRQVVTRQLGLTTVLASYCRDMDVTVAALLLAKGVLQDLPSTGDLDELAATQTSIGKHLQHMACRVGEPVRGSAGGWLGRRPKLWRLPFSMHPMAEALYGLWRKLSEVECMEELPLLRAHMVSAGADISLRMLMPRLHVFLPKAGRYEETLAANMALLPGSSAVLDSGDILAVNPPPADATLEHKACWDLVESIVSQRPWLTHVKTVTEGGAGGAELAQRLAPVHSDTPEQQLSQLPVLALLSESERQRLAIAYKTNKDKTFLQWCMSNGVVMEPSPDNVTPAMQSMGLIAE